MEFGGNICSEPISLVWFATLCSYNKIMVPPEISVVSLLIDFVKLNVKWSMFEFVHVKSELNNKFHAKVNSSDKSSKFKGVKINSAWEHSKVSKSFMHLYNQFFLLQNQRWTQKIPLCVGGDVKKCLCDHEWDCAGCILSQFPALSGIMLWSARVI